MTTCVCVAGASGWTGSAVTRAVLNADDLELTGAIARRTAGIDVGTMLGESERGLAVSGSLEDALTRPVDVLVDFTSHESVKERAIAALKQGVRVVIGTSGLTNDDYNEIEEVAVSEKIGVVAAGNFSITAALAKHFSLLAAKHLPSWEIMDFASAGKKDAPSGTVRELAEAMGNTSKCELQVPLQETHGERNARGATIGGSQVHSIRLPGFVLGFDVTFGLPNERLSIRHDAGSGAEPYVQGALLAIREVVHISGLVRGLDTLMFQAK